MSSPMSASKQLAKSLSRLAPHALALTAGSASLVGAAPEQIRETESLIKDSRRIIDAQHSHDSLEIVGVDASAQQVREAIEAIDRLVALCTERARVFLEMPSGILSRSISVRVIGYYGFTDFSFLSGTTMEEMAQAVNRWQSHTSVHAEVAVENENRLEFKSTSAGSHSYVSVVQIATSPPVVFAHPVGGLPTYEYTDFGCYEGIPCQVEFASAYLATGASILAGGEHAVGFVVWGGFGPQSFAFMSGTSASDIVAALNSMTYETGVTAALQETGVQVRSLYPALDYFVSVSQLNGPPMVHSAPGVGAALMQFTDIGTDRFPGDLNGDDVIDQTDLTELIGAWGNCPIAWPPGIPPYCPEDFTQDHRVDIDDLLVIIQYWGPGRCP